MTRDKKKIKKIRKEIEEVIQDKAEKYGILSSTLSSSEEGSVENVEEDIPPGTGDVGIYIEINDVDIPLATGVENYPPKREKWNKGEPGPKKHDDAPPEHTKGEKDNDEKDNAEEEKDEGESEGNDKEGNMDEDKDDYEKGKEEKENEKEEEKKDEEKNEESAGKNEENIK